MDERVARMALCAVGHLASPALAELVAQEGAEWVWASLKQAGESSALSRRAQVVDLAEIERLTVRCGARFLIPGDDEWPAGLASLASALVGQQGGEPSGLWVRGRRLEDTDKGVALVGARAASQYGEHVAMELAADLAALGRPIISGLAYGIDAAAHRGALSVGGPTVAVVASGVDQPYPAGNAGLATMIGRRGTIVSEVPPGTSPTRPAFLARNRLIAALGAGIVVVEAALRSGAKNTAAWGNEIGRVVMAVPGPVTSSTSQTPHRLIRDGQAVLVTDSRDVRELLDPLGTVEEAPRRGEDVPLDRLSEDQRTVREAFEVGEEVGAGTIARRTGLPMAVCLATLEELAQDRWIEEGESGGWCLPHA